MTEREKEERESDIRKEQRALSLNEMCSRGFQLIRMSECPDRGTKLSVFFVLLTFFTSIYTSPLVLDDASSCSKSKLGNSYFFTNEMRSTSKENVTVYFNLCDKLPSKICGNNVSACVKHNNGTIILKGNLDFSSSQQDKKFSLGFPNSIGKTAVGVTLDIQIMDICSIMQGVEMKIEESVKGRTTYYVYVNDPTCPCTIRIKDKHLDLRPIKGTYSVQSSPKNFSISLCEPNKLCEGADVTACIMETGKTEPLSEMSQEMLEYHKSENQVVLKGKYKNGRTTNKFELRLQCNWIMTTPKIFSTGNPTYYYYNLSSLNNEAGYMVANVSDGSSMYINPCGRLKFSGEKNFCTDTYSQICEVKGSKFLNKGSMLKSYEARAADLWITYASGIRCKDNDTKQYETHISFGCSKRNENPKVVKSDECDLIIQWNTPAACLKVRKRDCDQIPEPRRHSCAVEHDGNIYDLSKLAKENSSYVLKDKDDPSIEYLLNVCQYVVDEEAACIKGASVILKDSTELDIRKRFKLLGKLNSLTMVNEKLVIDATNGHVCDQGEYSSKIIFVCSEKDVNTYSQICEVKGSKFLNKGSMLKSYEARAADLWITYASGIRCKDNDTKQYETHISFGCSKRNENPKVVKSDECDLIIQWNTPAACLKVRKRDCDQIPEPRRHSCAVEHDGNIYDLSKLAKENSSYVLKDKDDPSIEYLLNVCQYVVDEEAACIKGASVILKDSTELDIRKRFKLLGKLNSLTMVNEKLVIDATNGHVCDQGEYSSKIIFVCSEKDNKTCFIDFKNPEESVIKVALKNTSYYFNICRTGPGTKCSDEGCLQIQPKKLLFVHEGKNYLDFQLNRSCQSPGEFNRTLIELLCEPGQKSKDHSSKLNITNCILYLAPVISKACSNNKDTEYQSDAQSVDKTKYSIGNINNYDEPIQYENKQFGDVINKTIPIKNTEPAKKEKTDVEAGTKLPGENNDERKKKKEIEMEIKTEIRKEGAATSKKDLNCTSFIKNDYTGYSFNISSLKLQVEAIGCPSIALNYSNSSVSIMYPTNNLCMKVRSTDSKYNVVMKCVPDSDYKIVHDDCKQMIINNLDACKLLERIPTSASYSKAAVAGISITVILILGTVVTVGVLAYVKIYRKRISYGLVAYEKVTCFKKMTFVVFKNSHFTILFFGDIFNYDEDINRNIGY
nr:unnamed protein product [Callosobruchus chinensis]